jgi:hypothetical protein
MLSNISWSDYLTFILVSSLIWYAFVFYNYYRHDLFQVIQVKNPTRKTTCLLLHYKINSQIFHHSNLNYQPETHRREPCRAILLLMSAGILRRSREE